MHLSLAEVTRRVANADILHRAAKAAHSMSFKVRQDNQRIIIDEVSTHSDFLEMKAISHGQINNLIVLVHDVDGAERPAIDL